MAKNTLKKTFPSTFNIFNDFLPPPPPVDKVHAPPRSNPRAATADRFRPNPTILPKDTIVPGND